MNLQPIEVELARAIGLFRGKLPDDQIQDMMDLAKAGEPGIALENLCTQLYEYEILVDKQSFDNLKSIAKSMNIDARYCERLDSLHR